MVEHEHGGLGLHEHNPPPVEELQAAHPPGMVAHTHDAFDWHSWHFVDHWVRADSGKDAERAQILRRTANFIPFSHDTAIRVLDIGSGTGALAHHVLEIFPSSEVVCHDYSAFMLNHARERLAWAGERVSFVLSDLTDPDWMAEVEKPFDAVVTADCLHYLNGPERIKAVYENAMSLVWDRGAFINCDTIQVPGPSSAQAYQRDRAFLEGAKTAPPPARRTPKNEGDPDPATLENQLRWLREAGFADVDCLLKDGPTGILGAFRF